MCLCLYVFLSAWITTPPKIELTWRATILRTCAVTWPCTGAILAIFHSDNLPGTRTGPLETHNQPTHPKKRERERKKRDYAVLIWVDYKKTHIHTHAHRSVSTVCVILSRLGTMTRIGYSADERWQVQSIAYRICYTINPWQSSCF